ncbi:MAG TPA: hypothetical protein VHE80_07345 [Acidimicrobiales bacterium]|nr:hypothetical protein [Acidimicrobiales bacterium]
MAASVLTRRIPAWSALLVVVIIAAGLLAALIAARQSAVELGPAVGTAERVEIDMTLCNHDVDRLDLNPRHEELELEGVLRDEGARAADVNIDRRDCPRPR